MDDLEFKCALDGKELDDNQYVGLGIETGKEQLLYHFCNLDCLKKWLETKEA